MRDGAAACSLGNLGTYSTDNEHDQTNLRATNYKGLYVDDFSAILGNKTRENNLLKYARDNGFTTLSLYDLQRILHPNMIDRANTMQLADFIYKAKTDYCIQCITAIGENADFFRDVISAYNHLRPQKDQKIDAYNLEFEFWNYIAIGVGKDNYCTNYLRYAGANCDVEGAFHFYMQQLARLHQLAVQDNCLCETYVGQFDEKKIKEMLPFLNRILIHAYVSNPSTSYQYTVERLMLFAGTNAVTNVIIIFSSEAEFSGPWLYAQDESAAFKIYRKSYGADNERFKSHVNLLGYQWFDYSNMPHIGSQTTNNSNIDTGIPDIFKTEFIPAFGVGVFWQIAW